jgi:predicted nucleic acid-binding protein
MSATFVDTNILLDVVTDDPTWSDWSIRQLEAASMQGRLLINDVVYAELAVRFDSIEALDKLIADAALTLAAMPRAALFLAAKAFLKYRAARGARTGVLPDFFIGAHAAAEGRPLLTRDAAHYSTYFPKLRLIAP